MKRNLKMLIAAVVVLTLLVAAYFLVPKLLAEKEDTTPITSDESGQQTSDSDYIINEKTDDVESVTFSTGEIIYTVKNGETPTIEGYTSHVIDNNSLLMALFNGTSVISSRTLEENGDLSKYGLDKEDKYVSVKLKNGQEKKVIIGNPTNISGEYYARSAESNTVYVISETTATELLTHPQEFRNLDVVEIVNNTVSEFTVEKSGEKVLDVKYISTSEAGGQQIHVYELLYPYTGVKANMDSVNMFCQALGSVTATEIVEENPVNLSKYGLDKPYVLTVKDEKATSTIKMGSYAEDGDVYVMKGDVPVVYKAPCSFYETVKNLNADEFVDRFIHLFNVSDVSGITVRKAQENHSILINKKSEDTYDYKIDGKIKVKDNFTPIYTSIIGVTASSFMPGTEPGGEEYCTIKFDFNDKTSKSFTYFAYDDRYSIVKADNGLACLVTTESIDDIFKSFDK